MTAPPLDPPFPTFPPPEPILPGPPPTSPPPPELTPPAEVTPTVPSFTVRARIYLASLYQRVED